MKALPFRSLNSPVVSTVAATLLLTIAQACHAHFLWLKAITHEDKPQAYLFFGENVADEFYHLPERLAETEVWRRTVDGQRAKLETDDLENDDRIGLVAPLGDGKPCVLEATQNYGIYGTSLLTYYAKHIHAQTESQFNAAGPSKKLKLDVAPRLRNGELEFNVLWNGSPLEGAKARIAVGDAEAEEQTTGAEGRVLWKPAGEGMIALLVNYLDKSDSGEFDGKPYKGVMHYASLTFPWPLKAARDAEVVREAPDPTHESDRQFSTSQEDNALSQISPLPEPVSSFGAAVADGYLYVYSGHTGEEHQHSAANLSQYFRRIQLDGSSEWEELPMQTPLQGLALVSYDGKIYRIGGMNARNATIDDEEDLHSVDEFAEFDPVTGQWRALAPLPAARSSHNAVVIGDRLYVVGGWQLAGSSPGEWQPDALVFDFADPQAGWQPLPATPFVRRALAASHRNRRLVALGGMNDEGKVSQQVDIFDPSTGQWSRGPDLPGKGMAGFGVSACNAGDELYASGLRGIVYQLNEQGSAWEVAGRLKKGRFFHQLLPADDGELLAVGGASHDGHIADIERIQVR